MADNINVKLAKTFENYVQSCCAAGQTLTEEVKKEITDKGVVALLKECCSEEAAKACESQVFSKYCDKKTNKLKVDVFVGDFLTELAVVIIQTKQKLDKPPEHSNADVQALVKELKEKIAAKADAAPTEAKGKEVKRPSCCRS